MKAWQPFMQLPQPLQITVMGERDALNAIEFAVEEDEDSQVLALTRGVDPVVPNLVLLIDESERVAVHALIARAALPFKAPEIREMRLKNIDWVSKVQKDFPPFTMGPFYVHGSHAVEAKPHGKMPLLIDAAAAFGTGEHATTAGCLLALADEKRVRAHTSRVLDMGCGTAILAIGAARLWKKARIEACDNDPVAVRVSAHNVKVNRVASRSSTFVSDGYKARQVRGKYPVVVANILAKPLMKMARDASRHVAEDGTLILSGLLNSQEAMVLSAHRAQGRFLKKRIRRGNWSVLILK